MTQSKEYIKMLHNRCGDAPEELKSMANSVDDYIGYLLYFSFVNAASYEAVQSHFSRRGELIPVSRRTFYRKRKQYIDMIERKQSAAETALQSAHTQG